MFTIARTPVRFGRKPTLLGRTVSLSGILRHIILLTISGIVIFPFWWVINLSLRPAGDLYLNGYYFLPPRLSLESYVDVFEKVPAARWFLNSVLVSVVQTVLVVVVSFLAAFALTHFRFRGRNFVLLATLATLMIPVQTLMVPIYVILANVGWLDTYLAVIVPNIATAFGIFMLRQFFRAIPPELSDAAKLDGAGNFGILQNIYLPLARPGIAALAVFSLLEAWNDYYWPLLTLTSRDLFTLPVALIRFKSFDVTSWGPVTALAVLTAIPPIVIYLIAQRYYVRGLSDAATRG